MLHMLNTLLLLFWKSFFFPLFPLLQKSYEEAADKEQTSSPPNIFYF